jgi:hypothetical protein
MRSIGKILNNHIKSNDLRRQICNVNWSYHKPELIERLETILSEINNPDFLIAVYSSPKGISPKVEGHEAVTVKFLYQSTYITYHEDDSIVFDYENGAALNISHSDVGFDTMFIYPATSKQSGAKHKTLIIHHSDDGYRISDQRLKKMVGDLVIYHMYTSVLFRNTPLLRFKVALIKLKSFYYSYANPEVKFKYSSGIYIPLASLIVSFVALIVAIISLKAS